LLCRTDTVRRGRRNRTRLSQIAELEAIVSKYFFPGFDIDRPGENGTVINKSVKFAIFAAWIRFRRQVFENPHYIHVPEFEPAPAYLKLQ
jgi:hypothetical protein